MIGVDTNVLLRLFVVDDPLQSDQARTFFKARSPDDPAFISLITIVELVWLLDDAYEFAYSEIVGVLSRVLASADFVLERRDIVADAIALAAAKRIDFSDFLIAGVSLSAGCAAVMTFDRPAANRIPGMELLT
jgi:predicted nucleic-acid-binding protein